MSVSTANPANVLSALTQQHNAKILTDTIGLPMRTMLGNITYRTTKSGVLIVEKGAGVITYADTLGGSTQIEAAGKVSWLDFYRLDIFMDHLIFCSASELVSHIS